MRTSAAPLLATLLWATSLVAQAPPPATPLIGAAELDATLDGLQTLGSLLMLGAHPDDENTAVISYFARGRHIRTAYLSATRGEGGQNLIGSEQGPLMGVIRTQELLAARRIDGGEQFFTRSIDFGYSKTPEEALGQWGHDLLLADMVRIIRQFRPDVIVARFPAPPGTGGHGQHTAVGWTGPEAFEAAADPEQFPDLGEPWQAKRLYWNVFQFGRPRIEEDPADNPDRILTDIGVYDPVLGKSYPEVAGESRSMHRSQAMGADQHKGPLPTLFDYIAGERADEDLFDGVDTTWGRVPGAGRVGELLAKARADYDPRKPETIVPTLLEAWDALAPLEGYWPEIKKKELLHAIELAAGLSLDAAAERWDAAPSGKLAVELAVLVRSKVPVRWLSRRLDGVASSIAEADPVPLAPNEPATGEITVDIPSDAAYTQAPWLRLEPSGTVYHYADEDAIGQAETDAALSVAFRLEIGGRELTFRRPVLYRWVDPARGERVRSVQIVPPVAVGFTRDNRIFPDAEPRTVAVRLQANVEAAAGELTLEGPAGWRISGPQAVSLARKGQEATHEFQVTPPAEACCGRLHAKLKLADGREITTGMQTIEYEHIPIQTIFPEAAMRVERADVKLLSRKIGYVMGAGDRIPEALQELGAEVTLLGPVELASGDLGKYDAIVTGVRAVNVREDLTAARERLMDYVEQGGTLVVQYNTFSRRGPQPVLAPFPMDPREMTRDRDDRVTDETAPMEILKPGSRLLEVPNPIADKDFEGWIQERGLYFMGEWDERYEAPLATRDEGQPAQAGGLLYARHGKGAYVFTGLAFFRQLPAGVPGAYRLFANLVSAGK